MGYYLSLFLLTLDLHGEWQDSLAPGRRALKKGISYDYIMAREHINSSNNLIILLKHYAKNYSEKWWPFFLPSIDINLFYAFNAYIDKPI